MNLKKSFLPVITLWNSWQRHYFKICKFDFIGGGFAKGYIINSFYTILVDDFLSSQEVVDFKRIGFVRCFFRPSKIYKEYINSHDFYFDLILDFMFGRFFYWRFELLSNWKYVSYITYPEYAWSLFWNLETF